MSLLALLFMPPLYPFITRDMLAFNPAAEMQLQVTVQSDVAARVALRGLTREAPFTFYADTPSDSLPDTFTFPIVDMPIMVSADDVDKAFIQGNCFVTIDLLINGVIVQQLTSGYVYGNKAISWPNTQQTDLRQGGGELVTESFPAPASGGEIIITVPSGEVWRLIGIQFNLGTSANVGNRRIKVNLAPNGLYSIAVNSNTVLGASNEQDVFMADFGTLSAEAVDLDLRLPLPKDLYIYAGGTISTDSNLLTGDQYSGQMVTYEKFFATP